MLVLKKRVGGTEYFLIRLLLLTKSIFVVRAPGYWCGLILLIFIKLAKKLNKKQFSLSFWSAPLNYFTQKGGQRPPSQL